MGEAKGNPSLLQAKALEELGRTMPMNNFIILYQRLVFPGLIVIRLLTRGAEAWSLWTGSVTSISVTSSEQFLPLTKLEVEARALVDRANQILIQEVDPSVIPYQLEVNGDSQHLASLLVHHMHTV